MMKKRAICFLTSLALLASLLAVPALAASGGAKAADSRNGVVRVVALAADGYFYLGSAFGVGKAGQSTDVFVTNNHVVCPSILGEDGSYYSGVPAVSVWILKNSNAWNDVTGLDTSQCIPCEIVYTPDSGYPDMAIIRASEVLPGRVALPLSGDEDVLEVGDTIYALGYPGSSDDTETGIWSGKWLGGVEDVTLTSGVVSRFTTAPTFGNTRLIQHDAQINHGNSGGPLLDADGAVVGINTYGMGQNVSTGDGNSYYSVRIRYVTEKLDELGIQYDLYRRSSSPVVIAAIVLVVLAAVAAVLVVLKKRGILSRRAAPQAQPAPQVQPASAGDSGLRIQAQSGVFAGRRFAISGSVRIGRDPANNDLVYPAETPGISGRHCVVIVDGNRVFLKDLGSTHGTFLAGGQRLAANAPVQLNIGDRFWLASEQECFIVTGKGGV